MRDITTGEVADNDVVGCCGGYGCGGFIIVSIAYFWLFQISPSITEWILTIGIFYTIGLYLYTYFSKDYENLEDDGTSEEIVRGGSLPYTLEGKHGSKIVFREEIIELSNVKNIHPKNLKKLEDKYIGGNYSLKFITKDGGEIIKTDKKTAIKAKRYMGDIYF